jgi:PAS domain S-box-containing protein
LLENDPCQDVRQLSEALKMNESRLELAAEAANAGFWSLDPASKVFWVNNMMRQIFEFPADMDITFQLFIDKVHPDDLASLKAAMQRALAGEKCHVEYRIMLPDGSLRWIHSARRSLHV